VLEIAVMDMSHLDDVVSRFCLLAETSTSIVLNVEHEHQAMPPPKRDAAKPAARKQKA
jgi:Lrp/AsnC family transcriptional regulator, leucine-responsive regulatory protein